ncbi:hypothetical protein CO653_33430 [Rhizobium anhuiense]|nr:hypothetical protein CO653_33430 [Rhizobium anhuiense]
MSVWTAGRLHKGDFEWLAIEAELEEVRRRHYPHRVSRLIGMYVFPDLTSAERALSLNVKGFTQEYVSEIYVDGDVGTDAALDSNWITFADKGELPGDWHHRYWTGVPFPDGNPIWEALITNRTYVLGTDIRERAYRIIEKYMPSTLPILEIGRLSAVVGSDLGNIACRLFDDGDYVASQHLLDMRDANNPAFLKRLEELQASGHPVRREAIDVGAEQGTFGTPDLGRMEFRIAKDELLGLGIFSQLTGNGAKFTL